MASQAPVARSESAFGRLTAAQYLATLADSGQAAGGRAKGRPGGKRRQPEEDLHRTVFEWVFAHERLYPQLRWFFHTPNGGARSAGEAGKLKAMGVRPGVSDVICPFVSGPWKGFACELKAGKSTGRSAGRLSEAQDQFLQRARADGWACGVATTLDEFIDLASLYLQAPGLGQGGRPQAS